MPDSNDHGPDNTESITPQTPDATSVDSAAVRQYLLHLQDTLCRKFSSMDGKADFAVDEWQRPEGGGGKTRILENGALFERAGVGVSHVYGNHLPPSASAQRPELAGRHFEAMGLSLVFHPDNPYIPTTHANIRFFIAEKEGEEPVWWFGGGFDLTPYYGFVEDCVHWHKTAQRACAPFGESLHGKFKAWCDDYFFLKHRQEARGIGGLFFDDFNQGGFENSFAFMRSIGDHIIPAYQPIVERRRDTPFDQVQKNFQRYRRGRYVEFNLVYDRGTLFGLQSGGRTESILMSMPPDVAWTYNWQPEPGSAEAALYSDFLPKRDWLA